VAFQSVWSPSPHLQSIFLGASGVPSPLITLTLFSPSHFPSCFLKLCKLGAPSAPSAQELRRCLSTPYRATSPAVLCRAPRAHTASAKRGKLFPSPLNLSFMKLLSYLLSIVLSIFPSHHPGKSLLIRKLFYNTDSLSSSCCAVFVLLCPLLDGAGARDSRCIQDAGAPDICVMVLSGFLVCSLRIPY